MNASEPTTADFRTFSDPVKWIDRKNVIIDTTMLRDDDGWWYRASKDSEITIERTRNPYAVAREVLRTDDPNEWSFVGTLTDLLGNGRYSEHYLEGPELFVFNDDDVATVNGRPMRYGLMCDQMRRARGTRRSVRRIWGHATRWIGRRPTTSTSAGSRSATARSCRSPRPSTRRSRIPSPTDPATVRDSTTAQVLASAPIQFLGGDEVPYRHTYRGWRWTSDAC